MNSKPVHTSKKIVNKTNVHDFFWENQKFQNKIVDLKNCSLIQKYFMSMIWLVFPKSLYVLALGAVRSQWDLFLKF